MATVIGNAGRPGRSIRTRVNTTATPDLGTHPPAKETVTPGPACSGEGVWDWRHTHRVSCPVACGNGGCGPSSPSVYATYLAANRRATLLAAARSLDPVRHAGADGPELEVRVAAASSLAGTPEGYLVVRPDTVTPLKPRRTRRPGPWLVPWPIASTTPTRASTVRMPSASGARGRVNLRCKRSRRVSIHQAPIHRPTNASTLPGPRSVCGAPHATVEASASARRSTEQTITPSSTSQRDGPRVTQRTA